jgi:4-hydroxybenzoate polyprenyltransferase
MGGMLLVPMLLALAFGLSLALLPPAFTAVLAVYWVMTFAYSLRLKRIMMVDVMLLAMLYTMRIIAGAAATGLVLTFWILAFSMFMFLSLALVKRFAELRHVRKAGEESAGGRGYQASDLEMLSALGAAAGYLAVMVLALYINDAETVAHYRRPHYIWLACPLLLYWISRVWMLTHRGQMHDDPVLFAVRDRVSLGIGGLLAGVFWLAT